MQKSSDYNSWRLKKLSDPERAARYLKAALEESTEAFFYAFKNVIQAHEVATLAKKAGVARESLYRSFSPGANPTWGTLRSVLEALDLKFSGIEPRIATSAVMPVPEAPKASVRNSRKRKRGSSGNRQQLVLSFELQKQNVPAAAASSTVQRNTGSMTASADVEASTASLSPAFLAYVQQSQSTVLSLGH
jgi:probable addiction module antidote protein